MSHLHKHPQNTIDKVDNMIRQNNKKYLDQKSQLQYQKALKQYQKIHKRELIKQYAQHIKQGNKKAIQKKRIQSINKTKNKPNKSKNTSRIQQIQTQKILPISRQKLSQKQIKKVQQSIQARAQRLLQQMQLQKLNKKLQQQKKRTKLYQLKQTCQKLLSKSHKRVPQVSQRIPEERRVMLQQFSKKAQQQVQELDNIIAGLISKSKGNNRGSEINNNKYQQAKSNDNKKDTSNNKNKSRYQIQDEIFSDKFEIQFMNEVLSHKNINSKKQNNSYQQSPQDILFTKSASQLFQMNYIPI